LEVHGPGTLKTMANRILLCSRDSVLVATREMVLIQVGFDVSVACDAEALAAIPNIPPVQLAVIGHTLTGQEREAEVRSVLQRWPDAAILYLSLGFEVFSQVTSREFRCGTNPVELVEACKRILST
jgi:hypothetical protein